MIFRFNVGLKTLLHEGLSEPAFYGHLVYKLKKLIGRNVVVFFFSVEKNHYSLFSLFKCHISNTEYKYTELQQVLTYLIYSLYRLMVHYNLQFALKESTCITDLQNIHHSLLDKTRYKRIEYNLYDSLRA